MGYSKEIVEKYITKKNEQKEERVNISEKTKFFKLRNSITERTNEKIEFIKEIKKYNAEENIIDEYGSGAYNFKTGNTMIQLDIAVNKDTICIKPYIVYNKEEVKEDFLRVLKLDEELDNILKQNRL